MQYILASEVIKWKSILKLENELRIQWEAMNAAKSYAEVRELRAKALETFNNLKKTKQLLGVK